jgi:hypothetical protein
MSNLDAVRAALAHLEAVRDLLVPLWDGKAGPLDSFTRCAQKADDCVWEAHVWLGGALEVGERPLIVQHETAQALTAIEALLAEASEGPHG